MHEPLDIGAVNRGNRQAAEQRFDMASDSAAIGQQRAQLFGTAAPCQQAPGVGEGAITKLGNGYRLTAPPRKRRSVQLEGP